MTHDRGLLRAFILHRREYTNTSLLLEMFVEGSGRLPAIAKGARRGRAPASALLQPFQPLWIGLTGRGEVRTLTHCEGAGRPFSLTGTTLPCGFYLNEILLRLLGRQDPHDALFAFYHSALDALAGGADLDSTLRRFELHLLAELGYAPSLSVAEDGDPVQSGRAYLVEPGRSPRLALTDDPGTWVSGATLQALTQGEPLRPEQTREARALLRRLLAPHIGTKPLKSRELFRHRRMNPDCHEPERTDAHPSIV